MSTQAATSGRMMDADAGTVRRWLEQGEAVLIDVREPSEHAAEHIEGAALMPLSRFQPKALPIEPGKKLVLHCKSGARSRQACQKLIDAGAEEVWQLEGGIQAWRAAGLPTASDPSAPKVIDLQRQVHIVIGSVVLLGVTLGYFVSPWFLLLAGFMGAGLAMAGITGFCGLAMLMARLPYNQRQRPAGAPTPTSCCVPKR